MFTDEPDQKPSRDQRGPSGLCVSVLSIPYLELLRNLEMEEKNPEVEMKTKYNLNN